MRIIHIISSPASGGAENYIRDLSISTNKQGHDVKIIFISSALDSGRDTTYEEIFLKDLTESNIPYSFIGHSSRKNPVMGILKLRYLVSRFKPDIVHSHLFFGAIFSFFSGSNKKVYTHHSVKTNKPKIIFGLIESRMNAIIAISKQCEISLKKVTNKDITRIDNGTSSNRLRRKNYDHTTKHIDNGDCVNIVSVGRLTEQKNLELMIKAIDLLKKLPIKLTIIGEGPSEENLKKIVVDLYLHKKIEFIGNVSNVSNYLENADIFAMSSLWEGLPISLIEATLSGLPIITTNVGGCAEIVNKCKNGLVVDSLQPKEYSEQLSKLIISADTRKTFGKYGLKYGEIYYSINRATNDHLKLYNKLLTEK